MAPEIAQPDPTEPDPAVPDLPAEAPFALQIVVWVGVLSGITWGLMALFRDRSVPGGPPDA